MNLFRTCRIANSAPALKFVKRAKDIGAVVKLLTTREMIDDVFARPLPISKIYESRFGPAGLHKNVLYSSEKKDTTLFEYGYHLLRDASLLNKPIFASTYNLLLTSKNRPLDVTKISGSQQILDRHSYKASHSWITTQVTTSLDVIRYPNVRDPNPGGFNFAIFNRQSVTESGVDPETLIMTTQKNKTVVVQRQDGTELDIRPLI